MKSGVKVEADGIILTNVSGEDSDQDIISWAKTLKETVQNEYKRIGKKVKILTDITGISIFRLTNDITIKETVAQLEREDKPFVLKSAAFTPSFAVRGIANLLGKISGRRDFLVFKTKEDAIIWLNSGEFGKTKEDVIKETAHEIFNLIKDSKDESAEDVSDYVSRLHDYSNMRDDAEFELFSVQQGTILIAYNYLKENPGMQEEQAISFIAENYSELLSKYSTEE